MRRHFARVTDGDGHPDLREGLLEVRSKPFPTLKKGEERVSHRLNRETGEEYDVKMVYLGYHDFENQEEYEQSLQEVVEQKMDEVDYDFDSDEEGDN